MVYLLYTDGEENPIMSFIDESVANACAKYLSELEGKDYWVGDCDLILSIEQMKWEYDIC